MAPSRIPDRSPSPSEASDNSHDEEFPLPNPKRRRLSGEEVDAPVATSYTAPSRIQKVQVKNLETEADAKPNNLSSIPTTDDDFESLNVAPWLIHSLSAMAIQNPTAIQRSCIPEILKGRDCIGGSRTGTGKTVAFAVPILQKWAEDPFGIYAVILTPTRELALQIYEQFQALGAPHSLKAVLITGGSEMRPQAAALAKRPHIVVATPGRLADHIQSSGKETTIGLSRAKVVVLDEADRLLAPGPGSMLPDINTCLGALPLPTSRLTLLFTATITPEVRALKSQPRPPNRPPLFVSEIADDLTANRTLIPATLKQTYLQIPLTHKDAFLHVLLSVPSVAAYSSIIIFTNRTATADILHRTLMFLGHSVTSLHSELPQSQRNKNLTSFRAQKSRILVATDVAGRGLDIPAVNLVINFDVPRNPVDYVHRVGRTARAGRDGTSITFVGQRDVELILAIENYIGGATQVEGKSDKDELNEGAKMQEWTEEGVNIETRVVKGRVLKDVGEARMEATREIESGKDVNGWRKKIKKDRKRALPSA